ncbi:hypothetical protein JW979_09350 [bacterium]|nr:hypothetical protein [candidate division CSSED10-310 bacterium]
MSNHLYITIIVFGVICMLNPVVLSAQDAISTPSSENQGPRPPIIVDHDPITAAKNNEPIDIEISIHGARPESDEVFLHFREKGPFDFHVFRMGYNPETKNFEKTIDINYHGNEDIEYYIEIFPEGLLKIRVPEDGYYEINSYTSSEKYIKSALIILLIASPALIAYFIGRIYRAHVKRATIYQQKLNKRKRQLAREREKHYKDYLKKLTGVRPTNNVSKTVPANKKELEKSTEQPSSAKQQIPENHSTPPGDVVDSQEEKVSTQELKRELDEILNRRPADNSPKPPPRTTSKTSQQKPPTGKMSSKEKDLERVQSRADWQARKHLSGISKPKPVDDPSLEKTNPGQQPRPNSTPPAAPRSVDIPPGPSKQPPQKGEKPHPKIINNDQLDNTRPLNKNERDKLLDILGLDL